MKAAADQRTAVLLTVVKCFGPDFARVACQAGDIQQPPSGPVRGSKIYPRVQLMREGRQRAAEKAAR
jgi:hypothetical protein